MIPVNLVAVVALVSALVSGIGSWWVTAALKNTDIAAIEKRHAEQERDDAQAALQQFQADAKVIHDAAQKAQLDLSSVNAELGNIRKEFKNATKTPLPAGCKPDAPRVRALAKATDAVDQAITGPLPSGPVQNQRSP